MKAKHVLMGIAAGVGIGLLLAPRKGSETRKMLTQLPESMLDTLKYRFYQVTDLFSGIKNDVTDAAEKVAYKTHNRLNKVKSEMM